MLWIVAPRRAVRAHLANSDIPPTPLLVGDPPLLARLSLSFPQGREFFHRAEGPGGKNRGYGQVNHARIAAEALRYRLDLLDVPPSSRADFDLEAMAGATVTAADPTVDGALRRIATAWTRAGLDPDRLCERWACPEARALFESNPDLIDALDDIVRFATHASRNAA